MEHRPLGKAAEIGVWGGSFFFLAELSSASAQEVKTHPHPHPHARVVPTPCCPLTCFSSHTHSYTHTPPLPPAPSQVRHPRSPSPPHTQPGGTLSPLSAPSPSSCVVSPPPAPGCQDSEQCHNLRINHGEQAAGPFPSGKNKQVKINK